MLPPTLITAERVRARAEISSKKRLLQTLAGLLASDQPGVGAEAVFDRLLERERLGSTGLGHGVALPHARIKELDQVVGAFLQLEGAVAFDAIDNQPVDLVFGLLVPDAATEQHLILLASLAEMFSDADLRADLRAAAAPEALLDLLTHRGGQAHTP